MSVQMNKARPHEGSWDHHGPLHIICAGNKCSGVLLFLQHKAGTKMKCQPAVGRSIYDQWPSHSGWVHAGAHHVRGDGSHVENECAPALFEAGIFVAVMTGNGAECCARMEPAFTKRSCMGHMYPVKITKSRSC